MRTMVVEEIPLDDKKTFELLGSGQTLGCFQIDGRGMQGLLKKVRPTSLNDISAVLALFRPGPIDNGSHTEYARRKDRGSGSPSIHPELDPVLEPILSETYGLIVYQEQVLAIINAVTGWDYAEAELIFSAMRKKKIDKMEEAQPSFFAAAADRGYSTGAVQALWDVLVPFSDYSFNKAHSIAYAHISYWTAYLKANYPVQYMTALLTGEEDPEKFKEYLDEVLRMGIRLLPPDINASGLGFTATKEGIRYGLASIKGCGESATSAILSGRPFNSIDEFFRKANSKVLNAGVLKALIESGCLDSLWADREVLLLEAPELAGLALDQRAAARKGARGLLTTKFQPSGSAEPDWNLRARLEAERLGVVLSAKETILRLTRELSEQETTYMTRQLLARPGRSAVILKSGEFDYTLTVGVDPIGLETVMTRIGVQVL